jgi:hypothetical protein
MTLSSELLACYYALWAPEDAQKMSFSLTVQVWH